MSSRRTRLPARQSKWRLSKKSFRRGCMRSSVILCIQVRSSCSLGRLWPSDHGGDSYRSSRSPSLSGGAFSRKRSFLPKVYRATSTIVTKLNIVWRRQFGETPPDRLCFLEINRPRVADVRPGCTLAIKCRIPGTGRILKRHDYGANIQAGSLCYFTPSRRS
jgi:hypothetical protein